MNLESTHLVNHLQRTKSARECTDDGFTEFTAAVDDSQAITGQRHLTGSFELGPFKVKRVAIAIVTVIIAVESSTAVIDFAAFEFATASKGYWSWLWECLRLSCC